MLVPDGSTLPRRREMKTGTIGAPAMQRAAPQPHDVAHRHDIRPRLIDAAVMTAPRTTARSARAPFRIEREFENVSGPTSTGERDRDKQKSIWIAGMAQLTWPKASSTPIIRKHGLASASS